MWWLIPAISGGLSILNANKQNKQNEILNNLASETTRYGYRSGQTGKLNTDFKDALSEGIGGAIQGFGVAQGLTGKNGIGWMFDEGTGDQLASSAGDRKYLGFNKTFADNTDFTNRYGSMIEDQGPFKSYLGSIYDNSEEFANPQNNNYLGKYQFNR